MDSESIEFRLDGKCSKLAIDVAFRDQANNDRDTNGHQDGYSGDFQTVGKVDHTYLGEVFKDCNAARDFCLDKAVKWETVISVYYHKNNGDVGTLVAGWGAC